MSNLLRYMKGEEAELESQEFVAKKSANFVLWIILGFFALVFIWAAFTQIDRTVRGVGKVVPSSKLQVVSNLEGGVVEQILVKAGDTVQRGDVLVRLSPTLTTAAYGSTEAEVAALQTRISRLNAEVRGATPTYGDAPASQVEVERSLHAARADELKGIVGAGSARVVQAERAVAEAQSALEARRSNLATAQREVEMLRPLVPQKIIPEIEFVRAENAAEVARNEVNAAEAALARARSGIAEASA